MESSLAAVNYCRRILHALAAISDYPTREPIQLESDDLTRLINALAKALDDLAASLEMEPIQGDWRIVRKFWNGWKRICR